MGTYPWGPHGPQSGPNEVTPNPTPAYVPPPPTPSWDAPSTPSYGGGGYSGGATGTGGAVLGTGGPPHKSYFLAIILSTLFGPLGLLYSSKMMGVLGLVTFSFLVYTQVAHVPMAVINASGGFLNFMANNALLDHMWSVFVFWSVVLGIIGVFRFNQANKKKKD